MPEIHQVGRTVTTTTATYTRGGKAAKKFKERLRGAFTPDRAQRELRRRLDDDTVVVLKVEHEKAYYQMSLETFLEHAQKLRVYPKEG